MNVSLNRFISLLIVLVFQPAYPQGVPNQQMTTLGTIKNRASFDGCGCTLFRNRREMTKDQALFVSDMSGNALINVDRTDLRLHFLNGSPESRRDPRIGDRSWQRFKGKNVEVRVDYRVSRICPPKDESCEVVYYSALITVTRHGHAERVQATGMCGC